MQVLVQHLNTCNKNHKCGNPPDGQRVEFRNTYTGARLPTNKYGTGQQSDMCVIDFFMRHR